MELIQVKQLAQQATEIFKREYLFLNVSLQWDFTWKSKATYGRCCYKSGYCLIQISYYHWNYSDRKGIWNTICHELCHAYDTHRSGHGYYWKQIADHMSIVCGCTIKRVGGDGEFKQGLRQAPEGPKPVGEFHCSHCGMNHPIYKRGRAYQTNGRGYTCGRCGCVLEFKRLR